MPEQQTDLTLGDIQKFFGNLFTAITQGFSPTHRAIDIAAPKGTPVRSIVDGTVIYAEDARDNVTKAQQFWVSGDTTSGGKTVIVEDRQGRRYFYQHLSEISVAVGDAISINSLVGKVGETGTATGPHLHFAILDWNTKQWINPTSKTLWELTGNTGIEGLVKGLPDISGAIMFIGLLLVGIAFILLAGLIAKVGRKNE